MPHCPPAFLLALSLVSTSACAGPETTKEAPIAMKTLDLTTFSDAAPDKPLNLLFLHHSVGGALLADPSQETPQGGGLKSALENQGYRVHEASYGSKLGEHTDLFDWLPKFEREMDAVLRIRFQDEALADGETNQVVLFKSCFPNNAFQGQGTEPGSARGPELTEANAKATMRALLPIFQKHPEVLFVFLTTPPLAEQPRLKSTVKWAAKKLLGRVAVNQDEAATTARRFADWAASPDGWLNGYPLKNVVTFHFFDVLTSGGKFLRYPSGDDRQDSHPTAEGQLKARKALVPFLNRAVRRAGLIDGPTAEQGAGADESAG